MTRLLLLLLCASVIGCSRNPETQTVTTQTTTVDSSTSPNAAPPASSSGGAATRTDTVVEVADSSSETTSTWKTYRNDRYHFEFKYPSDLRLSEKFSTADILPRTWRAMATPDEPGHAVISIPIVHMTGRTAYPRFYDVEFRVGVSDSLTNCKAGNGERTIGPIVINGSTFNQFEFSDAATMKYVSGISYRTGHDGKCYAIEQVKAGSNYRDQPSSADIDQKALDNYYYLAGKIVKTFRFTDGR